MATNTHIPVRSARRCILRSAVTKFFFATAIAIATCFALALSGAITAGTVTLVTPVWIRVSSNNVRAFQYWHIAPPVRQGQQVTARQTLLGRVKAPSNHAHLTEYEGGRVVNPPVPGRLTPYHDSTQPTVGAITLRRTDSGPELLPNFVRGRVEIVAGAEDEPTVPGRDMWHGPG